ncbi:MAG: peptide/nickel transport system permease protein [Actinomycetota bacterium]|jgi:peptide/nickel transport system permease protein|nr:peptide/nickel transport system permease protein [Actinomycetota bacterium]
MTATATATATEPTRFEDDLDSDFSADFSAGATGANRRGGGWRRVARTVGTGILVLWGAATVTFIAVNAMPGNPAIAMAGGAGSHPSKALVAAVTAQYGFDKPLVIQYLVYLLQLVQGHLGFSSSQKMQVVDVIAQSIWPTLLLTGSALVLAWVIAIASSLLTVRRRRAVSSLGSGLEVLSAALPQYWLGIVLLEVFAFSLGWIPATGGTGVVGLILPALTLAIPLAGFMSQVTRDEFDAALEQPFVVSARARGMSDGGVRVRHALRHAILPGLTLSGWAIGSLISGAVIVETLFSRNGLGGALLGAVTQQDMPLTVGVTLIVALTYVIANIVVDAFYVIADPRLRSRS